MESREFDELTRDADSVMSRRKMLRLLGRVLLAATGVRWLLKLGSSTADALTINTCLPVNDSGACPSGWRKRRIPGFTPYYNGCGGEGITKDLVPNYFMDANFTPACNKHDLCYSDCGKSKDQCDRQFYDDLWAECDRVYPGFWNSGPRGMCHAAATGYYESVNLLGRGFWVDAQKEGCHCCL